MFRFRTAKIRRALYKTVLLPALAFGGGAAATVFGAHRAEATSRDASPYAATLQLGRVLVEIDLVREEIKVPSVAARMLDGNIAYVRVKQFQEHSHDELVAAAARLRAESKGKIAGVILDMRNNPGGLVDEAAEIADEFLPS